MNYEKYSGSGNAKDSENYLIIDVEVVPEKYDDAEIVTYLMDKNFPWKIHPLFSRVLVIGFKLPDEKPELLYYNDEKELLSKYWEKVQQIRPHQVVTFNGYNFDIPFIQIRSQINGIRPTFDINLNKWKAENSNHFDCMQILSSNQTFLNVALDISCRIFNIPIPEPRHFGEEVQKLYENGDMESIKEHCRQDVELTEKLFLKLRK
jgi:DNA polymerase elongation subunit (family B)